MAPFIAPKPGELRQVALGGSGWLRLHPEGAAGYDASHGVGRIRAVDCSVPGFGAAGIRRRAWPGPVAVSPDSPLRPGCLRHLPGAVAHDASWRDAPPCGRGAARKLRRAGVVHAPAAAQGRCRHDRVDKHTLLGDLTAPFVYTRLQHNAVAEPDGYASAALDSWAERARRWSAGQPVTDLPLVAPAAAPEPRPCFMFFISGDKVQRIPTQPRPSSPA